MISAALEIDRRARPRPCAGRLRVAGRRVALADAREPERLVVDRRPKTMASRNGGVIEVM